ncbi:hypothetical protein PIB30_057944 [Stylosanthes scabra]|uniref:Uncharacterized protein n=1 Tax=Stylosanthes scabra TaxID=79078 RepID=A0ABU6WLW3_9FABA|nr:hypothetical protein [Stylosanthes scabra]
MSADTWMTRQQCLSHVSAQYWPEKPCQQVGQSTVNAAQKPGHVRVKGGSRAASRVRTKPGRMRVLGELEQLRGSDLEEGSFQTESGGLGRRVAEQSEELKYVVGSGVRCRKEDRK